MVESDGINIYYGKKYPFVCRTILNAHKSLRQKENPAGGDHSAEEKVKFVKDENVEELKVEFVSKEEAQGEKCINTTDKIFAKSLDQILQTKLYHSFRENNKKEDKQTDVYVQAQYDEWVDYFRSKQLQKEVLIICDHLNRHLHLNTFICGDYLTLSDLYVYYEMHRYFNVANCYNVKYSKQFRNVNRWFKLINCLVNYSDAELSTMLKKEVETNQVDITKDANTMQLLKQKIVSTSYVGKLENAEKGKVVTRFPPEPSGYLHIGHAKAAFLNSYYANMYEGKMLLRFDDTNPTLEDIKYETSIMDDLENLGLKYEKISYSSDYFATLEEYCIRLIKMEKAYADDTNVEEMRNQRGEGIESVNRQNSVEQNLQLFEEMRKGTEIGQKNCIRAKIDMQSKNKCMRDPVLYRCIVDTPHHRHGFKFKCYPTYDFACPIIDSIEGVTHALRTNEYSDRIEQYNWFITTFQLRKVYIYEFSRISFVKTVMSKRKLKWFVENKLVDGWLDPRMPTIKGILRRGLTKEALFQFILEQGPSKSGNLMQWDKLWSINKQIIDPIIPRFAAVDKKKGVILKLTDLTEDVVEKTRDLHMKNKSLGTCSMFYTNRFFIELEDAQTLAEQEEITLIKLGNVIITSIVKGDDDGVNPPTVKELIGTSNFDGDFKTTKKKIHWLPYIPEKLITCTLYEYDHLITVDKFENDNKDDWTKFINPSSKYETVVYSEPAISSLKVCDKFQFERRGYFIVDKVVSNHLHLIKIPDGKSKNMSIISSKVNPKNLAGTKNKAPDASEKR
ncbi:glutamate--tRNA ligase, putative [Plasmodium vivax]|uniref:glutamate--tRNA ligase n=2 Tax=Plasmodium vivax TaxID=5855 RepID=A5K8C9_PLAVS|nr:glutamate--tRNA ligase, putative [Plasmodium vivax]EDL44543.1 glutamate--tRNA ligase, putative [Plasmodium vivax]SCO68441.1 glutamate--tRNA ligase, putative [Plasmodium vivax]VUZ97332.1 glutamate--tRNA ligase, putative [Plasmodium vivax]|eukprot:XP_001614270.1 glutamate--tRNA ligase [Plasmodium vivax Sal-1]